MKKTASHGALPFSFALFSLCFLLICALLFYASFRLFNKESLVNTPLPSPIAPTVIIDAGHGGEDGGTIGVNGVLEKDINLAIAKKIHRALSDLGVNCVMTRSEDVLLYDRNEDYQGRKKALDMKARLKIATSYENVIFISVHQNSFPQAKYSGFQVYYSPNDPRSKAFAENLEKSVRASLQPQNNRFSKQSSGSIYLLDKLTCPAVLVECGFLSNADECALLSTEEYQSKLATVIASATLSFINTL